VDLTAMLIHDFNKSSKLVQTLTLHKMMMEFSEKWWHWKGSIDLNLVAVAAIAYPACGVRAMVLRII
jgi:hypothetical protein